MDINVIHIIDMDRDTYMIWIHIDMDRDTYMMNIYAYMFLWWSIVEMMEKIYFRDEVKKQRIIIYLFGEII